MSYYAQKRMQVRGVAMHLPAAHQATARRGDSQVAIGSTTQRQAGH